MSISKFKLNYIERAIIQLDKMCMRCDDSRQALIKERYKDRELH